MPWSKVTILGDGHPTFNRNAYIWYINPYYWADDHPLLYGNNGSLDPDTYWLSHNGIGEVIFFMDRFSTPKQFDIEFFENTTDVTHLQETQTPFSNLQNALDSRVSDTKWIRVRGCRCFFSLHLSLFIQKPVKQVGKNN